MCDQATTEDLPRLLLSNHTIRNGHDSGMVSRSHGRFCDLKISYHMSFLFKMNDIRSGKEQIIIPGDNIYTEFHRFNFIQRCRNRNTFPLI